MPHADLILTLSGALAAAVFLGYVTNRLGLSPIVGYLLAGIAVGPQTPGFVADQAIAEQLAELGHRWRSPWLWDRSASFSFILGALGKKLCVLTDTAMHTLVGAAIVSITLNPLLYRTVEPLANGLQRWPRLRRWLRARSSRRFADDQKTSRPLEVSRATAIVVGYGPFGRTLTRLL